MGMTIFHILLGNTRTRYGDITAARNPPVKIDGRRIKSIVTPYEEMRINVANPTMETIPSERETIAVAVFSYIPEKSCPIMMTGP